MMRFRSVLTLVLVVVAVFLVSCSSPKVASGPTYTADQLEQIQKYAEDVKGLRDRLLEIPPLVQQQEWRDVETFVHGPLGELRFKMGKLVRSLDPRIQSDASQAAKNVFGHLMLIDEAAREQNSRKVFSNYNGALQDFDAFLKLVPEESA